MTYGILGWNLKPAFCSLFTGDAVLRITPAGVSLPWRRVGLFAMMDNKARFWIAQNVANSKHDAKSLLKMGNEVAGKRPLAFVTDGLPAYKDAFNKEFRTMKAPRAKHVSDIHIKDQKKNNNIQERLNDEFRDRAKTFRGLQKDDSPSLLGMQIYHNFIKPHGGLDGDTPADRAGITVEGGDKWKTIIENAALYRLGNAGAGQPA